ELLWMGYTVTEIERSTGWNAGRIRLWVRDNQKEARVPPPPTQSVNAHDAAVTPHPTPPPITTRHRSPLTDDPDPQPAQTTPPPTPPEPPSPPDTAPSSPKAPTGNAPNSGDCSTEHPHRRRRHHERRQPEPVRVHVRQDRTERRPAPRGRDRVPAVHRLSRC